MYAGMTKEEWLERRRSGLGGSEIAAIMGMSPWATPVTVWLDKKGRAEPKEETEAMMIGTELEGLVARMYSDKTGREVRNYNTMLRNGCLIGNIDRLVVPEGAKIASHKSEIRTDAILECKTASVNWDDGVPLNYQLQVQHYMGLAPMVKRADVACLFLNHKHFELHAIERDDAVINHIQSFARSWWDEFVVGDKMPPPTNEADCKLLWERSSPCTRILVTDEMKTILLKYKAAKAAEKSAKVEADKLKSDIEAYMCDREILEDASGKPLATWKSASDKVVTTTDWEAVARDLADKPVVDEVAAKHTATKTEVGSRRFLVK